MTHRWPTTVFGLAAAAVAAAALTVVGLTWMKVVLAAIVIGCLGACGYAWFLARRTLRPLEGPAPVTRGMLMDWAVPFYDAGCRFAGLGRRFREQTLGYAGLKSGERVLDVGCGTGVLTRLAARAVGAEGEVFGIDPGPAMLAEARQEAAREGSRAQFRLAAVERLPFENGRFDAVLSSFMLHHLPPDVKHAGLREIYRVLRPGGRLLAVDLDRPANPLWWLLFWPLLFMSYTAPNLRGEVPAYLRTAGFAPVEVRARKGGLFAFWLAVKPAGAGV